MTIRLVTDEKIAETSSKGNQEKWYDQTSNRWYKLDQFGYEALSEAAVSLFLERSNLETDTPFTFVRYHMERLQVHGRERTGCSSKNFLRPGQALITVNRLLSSHLGRPLREKLTRLPSDKRRIAYLAEATADVTGLERFPQYLTLLFEIDTLFCNDDRHLNNIAVIEQGGQYDYCPIFDNGAGLLSNTQLSPMDIAPPALLSTLRARPFNTTFTRQMNAARSLYGAQLIMPKLTVGELREDLIPLLEYYPQRDRDIIADRGGSVHFNTAGKARRTQMKEKLIHFFKQETVLCAALALAALSMFLVRPDAEYLSYIDFRTLAILFCLMGAMAGLQKTGVFQWIAQALLARVRKTRQLVWILVLLCFFSSMAVTNDVALITFVPFTFTVLDLIGPEARKRLTIPIVVLQTIAANLGSMLTPIGNPQNLYLYGKAGLSLGAFLLLMLPYACVSFLLIMLWSIVQSRAYNVPVEVSFREEIRLDRKKAQLAGYLVLFALDLLTVARVIPYGLALLLTIAGLLVLDRSIFARVDYSLLLTFVGFFVFIGNMGRLPVFYEFLQKIVSGHELLAGAAASQVISNVPAALLLSGFTENFPPLIIGVNLGGLGTLIASMASLISYKFVAREEPGMKGTYFRQFTFSNVAFLAVLLVFALVLG